MWTSKGKHAPLRKPAGNVAIPKLRSHFVWDPDCVKKHAVLGGEGRARCPGDS